MLKFPIYLDYSATTPVDPRVAEKMIPFLRALRKPGVRSHAYGWEAEKAVEDARRSGGAGQCRCQGDHLDIRGQPSRTTWPSRARRISYKGKGKHVLTLKTEHKAVLDTVRELERQGFEATYLDVKEDGLSTSMLRAAIRPDTVVVSIMFVNNEIGVVQPIAEIGEICRERGVVFHVDAAQATGKSTSTCSSSGRPDVVFGPQDLWPQGHRCALRAAQAASGSRRRCTVAATNVVCARARWPHQIVGMGEAFRPPANRWPAENARVASCATGSATASTDMEAVYERRPREPRAAQPEHLVRLRRRRIADHGDQGCGGVIGLGLHFGRLSPSYVLRALGRNDELAHSSIRFSIGASRPRRDRLHHRLLRRKIDKLRELSPPVGNGSGRR